MDIDVMNEQFGSTKERSATFEIGREEVLERFATHPFANLETYKYFNQHGPEAAKAKNDFIDAAIAGNTLAAPRFYYPALDIEKLTTHREELTQLLDDVLQLDMQSEENRLLREKITDRLHEAGIMLLTKIQSTSSPEDTNYAAISYQLGENFREVYGRPDRQHWQGVLGYRMSQLTEVETRESMSAAVREAWEFVRDSLPSDLPIEEPYHPRPETIQWYRQQLEDRLSSSRQAVGMALESGEITLNDTNKLEGENIVKATKLALAAREIEGWDVVLTDESNIDTSQEHKTIFIPTTREMSVKQFERIILAHEIDEHVVRRENGDKSGELILGGTGCAGYLSWEEGNGKANEALLTGRVDIGASAFGFYLSGGLALGLDGTHGRNFGETFDLVWRMRYVSAYLDGESEEGDAAKRKIMSATYNHLMRLFRGTDGKVPGVIFTKDTMTYYLGQAEVYRKWDNDMVLSEKEREAEHMLERSAKINPLRPDHRRVARQATRV